MASRYIVQRDTAAWRMQVRISFALAILCTALGVLSMPGQDLDRAFLAIGMFFCLFSSFAVAGWSTLTPHADQHNLFRKPAPYQQI